jgi:hypothetical protein
VLPPEQDYLLNVADMWFVRPMQRGDGTTHDGDNTPLDPEVETFAKWFADWWLRRGSRLYAAAKKSDPDRFKKRKDSRRAENELPLRWDEETERIALDTERETED